ncbi:hypothetical protein KGY79_05935 [Candidatus Bipolaricaulota bacterium]|nr:hypothetical protein [Candidatus Bipolaricaulota bacterium]
MKKYSFTLILAAVLVTSLTVFGLGEVGEDFFDSGWHLTINDHVGNMNLGFDRNFGNNQWSVNLMGSSQLPQPGEMGGLEGYWGSDVDDTTLYTDVWSNAKSSLSESWTIGPWENGNNNYLLEMGTSASGDKSSSLYYRSGVFPMFYRNGIQPFNNNDNHEGIGGFAGLVGERPIVAATFDQVGNGAPVDGVEIAAGGPNSNISFDLTAYEDFGDMGYLPVADVAAHGTSDQYASFHSWDVLAGATFMNHPFSDIIIFPSEVNGIANKGSLPNYILPSSFEFGPVVGTSIAEFTGLGDGTLTVTGSGDQWLGAGIWNSPIIYLSEGLKTNTNGVEPGGGVGNFVWLEPDPEFDATYTYSKYLVRAAYEGGPDDETNWTFSGGGG